ncbi:MULTISPECIES: hypothetical protein [unclassified Sphingopyxis]|uniref:hypothetical protein n=1 Tax=unclassified Sphingopyxis TaxID=2614943 RepID=UPI0025FA0820|nr:MULTISPECIES: hypothetical protein [unclassified Sphingopyxis]
MAKRKPDVRQDGALYWFSLPKAAGLTGLTKKEMMRRADARELRTDPAVPDEYWFEREEIWALKMAKEARSEAWQARNPDGAKKRIKTPEQQEKAWEKMSGARAQGWRPGGGGVSSHYEKVLLSEIAEANRKRKDQGPK